MPLPSPNLDDRDFNQLIEEAQRRIRQSCPEWTDLSPGNPGMVLLELFAHLTETMIYRLNRIPDKAYIEFLSLIGVRVQPPAAASTLLRFERSQAADQALEIRRGTRVAAERADGGEPPVFVTARTVAIPSGETQVEVLAHHCELVEGELVGVGTGLPGLSVQAKRSPLVAPTGSELDLIVGVEAAPDELGEQVPVIQHNDKLYRIWREVDSFTNLGTDPYVYIADRTLGSITFAPAARIRGEDGELSATPRALAAVPAAGAEIRLWYRSGGGPSGNVAAKTLTVLKDPISGLEVTNPSPATGGRAGETLENALVRGPQELHSLHRAVTARDFELAALYNSRAIARAKALTRSALWAHALPGAVEVVLVPHLSEEQSGGRVTADALQEMETETTRSQIQRMLDERRPLGTTCVVTWARYKTVQMTARIVARREADQTTIRRRVTERLHGTINPLPTQFSASGWPFGQALRTSHVYDVALAEPGVLWVDQVRLQVEEVPDTEVTSITADVYQPRTWYAASGPTLFRSLNDGDGWEAVARFPDERIELVRTHPDRAGLVAVAARLPEEEGSRIHISTNAGETWEPTPYTTTFEVNDMALTLRDDAPLLLLATDVGLYELTLLPGGSPVPVLVDPEEQDRGFYAVIASRDVRGQINVAVAAQGTVGVFLSSEGGQPNSFRLIGLQGEDIRVLAVQYDGPRSFLWAGSAAAGGEAGPGCFRWELRGAEDPPEGWRAFGENWNGGSCRALAFLGTKVMAASHRAGVLRLKTSDREPKWEMPDVNCGLPLRDPGRFHPVDTVAADPAGRLVMAGGVEGVFRSADEGVSYEDSSGKEFSDKVTLPPTWLFCSGEHDLSVVSEDEAERD